jgi:hypothetical protein
MSTDGRETTEEGADAAGAALGAPDAAQIARNLTEKYGAAALAFARERAQRAIEVGDDIALDAWRSVIEATHHLLRSMADA